jgi:hypothetical protein
MKNVEKRNSKLESASYQLSGYGRTTGSVYVDKFGEEYAGYRQGETLKKYRAKMSEACGACGVEDCLYRGDPLAHMNALRDTAKYGRFRDRLKMTGPGGTLGGEDGIEVPCEVLFSAQRMTSKTAVEPYRKPNIFVSIEGNLGVTFDHQPTEKEVQEAKDRYWKLIETHPGL